MKKEELVRVRGNFCQCGCGLWGHDLHHCLIHRMKRYAEWLDDERNLVLVNHKEHISRKFDTLEWRKVFWLIQVKRYGEPSMMEWVNSLPDKLRHRLDFME